MWQLVRDLIEFHGMAGQDAPRNACIPADEVVKLRARLHEEGFGELAGAMEDDDMEKILDGIIDCIYVLVGTAVAYGFERVLPAAWMEAHSCNMSKVSPDGKVQKDDDGKVVKPEGWHPPDMAHWVEVAKSVR